MVKILKRRCRYCDKQIEGDRQRKIPAYADICFDKECTQKVQLACRQMLPVKNKLFLVRLACIIWVF